MFVSVGSRDSVRVFVPERVFVAVCVPVPDFVFDAEEEGDFVKEEDFVDELEWERDNVNVEEGEPVKDTVSEIDFVVVAEAVAVDDAVFDCV